MRALLLFLPEKRSYLFLAAALLLPFVITRHHIVAVVSERQDSPRKGQVGLGLPQGNDLDPGLDERNRPRREQDVDDGAKQAKAAAQPPDLLGVVAALAAAAAAAAAGVELDEVARGVDVSHPPHEGAQVAVSHALVEVGGGVGRRAIFFRRASASARRGKRGLPPLPKVAVVDAARDARVLGAGRGGRADRGAADLRRHGELAPARGEPGVQVRQLHAGPGADERPAAAAAAAAALEPHPEQPRRLEHRPPAPPRPRVPERDHLAGAVTAPDRQQRRGEGGAPAAAAAAAADDPLHLLDARRLDEGDAAVSSLGGGHDRRRQGPVV